MDRIQLLEKLKRSPLGLEEFGFLFDLPPIEDAIEVSIEGRDGILEFLFNPDYTVQNATLRELVGSLSHLDSEILGKIEDFPMAQFWDSLSNWTLYFLMDQTKNLRSTRDYDYMTCADNFFEYFNDVIINGWEFTYSENPEELLFKQISFFNFIDYSQRVSQRLAEIPYGELSKTGEQERFQFLNWRYTPPEQVLSILYREDFSKMEVNSALIMEYGQITQILVYLRAKDLGLESLSFKAQLDIVGRR